MFVVDTNVLVYAANEDAPESRRHVLTETDRHDQVLRAVVAEVGGLKGNLLYDAHVATLMREHGIRRIVTRDGDFRRFPFLEVVDPLAGPTDA